MNWDEMAVVGRVARLHGIRGQVIVNLETDFPQARFHPGSEFFVRRAGAPSGGEATETLTIAVVRFQQGRPVIGFVGVGDIDSAATLTGAELRVPVDRLERLPSGTYYHHDLVGCAVDTIDGARVGIVAKVEGTMGVSRLVVATPRGEILVPLAAEICRTIDPDGKRIVIAPPEGLLTLNERGT